MQLSNNFSIVFIGVTLIGILDNNESIALFALLLRSKSVDLKLQSLLLIEIPRYLKSFVFNYFRIYCEFNIFYIRCF